jgi:hypothetical protein
MESKHVQENQHESSAEEEEQQLIYMKLRKFIDVIVSGPT